MNEAMSIFLNFFKTFRRVGPGSWAPPKTTLSYSREENDIV